MTPTQRIFGKDSRITTPTYKEQAYHLIKEAILYQKLEVGEVYSQESISNELGISRTPTREALLELQREGYIQFNRGRGITVVPISKEEGRSIMEMRINNERFGARLAAKRATQQEIRKAEEILKQMKKFEDSGDGERLYRLDCDFHNAVMAGSHNAWIYKTVGDLRDHFLRFEKKSAYDQESDAHDAVREHEEIFDAIQSRDEERAGKAMEIHLIKAYTRTVTEYMEDL